jgi:MFS family permease
MTKTPIVNSARVGMNLGQKTGLILSLLYAAIGFVIIELLGIGAGFSSPYFYTSFPASFPWGGFTIVIIIIMLIAVLPATIIGGLTGACLGVLTEKTKGHISKYPFVLLCITSCLVAIILIHLLFQIPVSLSFEISNTDFLSFGIYESYPFCLGIPSVIYILTGGWIGWKLYSKAFVIDSFE